MPSHLSSHLLGQRPKIRRGLVRMTKPISDPLPVPRQLLGRNGRGQAPTSSHLSTVVVGGVPPLDSVLHPPVFNHANESSGSPKHVFAHHPERKSFRHTAKVELSMIQVMDRPRFLDGVVAPNLRISQPERNVQVAEEKLHQRGGDKVVIG